MDDSRKPAMEDRRLPRAVIRVLTVVMRRLLRSPVHRLASRQFMLLHVTGRRSGQVYAIPVGRHEVDGRLTCQTDGRWRANLKGGADVQVTLDGRRRRARAELVEDPERVAEYFARLVARHGYKKAGLFGMKVNVDRAPTLDEVRAATADRAFIVLTLMD